MKNQAGRDIPDNILSNGKQAYQGAYHFDGTDFQRVARKGYAKLTSSPEDKVVHDLKEAVKRVGLKNGMSISFHHHFRNGDYVVNKVVHAIGELGIKDITIYASSLGEAHDPLLPYIEDGTVTGLSSSGVRGKIGEAISHGLFRDVVYIRSHGGRVRAVESGDIHIDVAFIGAPSADCMGNARGKGGKSDCGVLSYAMIDAQYADKVVIVTDTLVDFPNFPPAIQAIDVDVVAVVDEIGNPAKIASKEVRYTDNPKELMMADYAARFIAHCPNFKDGFSFQAGAGGAALAVVRCLKQYMAEKNYKMSFAIGGITAPIVQLLHDGLIKCVVDAQDFDLPSAESVIDSPGHFEISTSQYANPFNKGAFVNMLDFAVLGALEIDTDFNVNVIVGSDGIVRGAPGGHPDAAAGAKVSIIITPLIRSRIPVVIDKVTTVTTPGETVDVLITEEGIAINPRRTDLIDAMKDSGLPITTIEALRDKAYRISGAPEPVHFDEKVVAVVEYRDGTVLDVIRKTKPFEFSK